MAKSIPINPRIIEQLAKATVKNLIDGIVELITNSDDSYKRLEETEGAVEGVIKIEVSREKGGICKRLVVKDYAEGMTSEELEKAIEFAGETSGFEKGRSVRGLFGRGLKETIIALGEGEIKTVRNGQICKTKLWFDKNLKAPLYDDELLKLSQETSEINGTEINIKITNEKIKIPECETFIEQLSRHYALRDILSNERRKVELTFEDLKRSLKRIDIPIKFNRPEGKKCIDKILNIPGYGDKVNLVIYESDSPLDSPRNNPFGLAGILIKTKGAILDNQLFKFENESAALYFFGEAMCEGLEERLREGELGIIDPNRGGLEWRHEYCQKLTKIIESELEPLIHKKRKELEKKPEKEVKETTKKMLRKLCSVLNEIAKKELEEMEGPPEEPEPNITDLVIKPEIANIQLNKPRTFSIYAPSAIVEQEGPEASIDSDSLSIRPLPLKINLEHHPKYRDKLWYGCFKVIGKEEAARGTITVKLGRSEAFAKIRVAPPHQKPKGEHLSVRKGGFVSDIKPDESDSPIQRSVYNKDSGEIRIFIKFPSVGKFIKSGFEGLEEPEGRVLLTELVGEAFCRHLAIQQLEIGKIPKIPGSEIESYITAVNELQKKYLHKIQEIIFEWKFKE